MIGDIILTFFPCLAILSMLIYWAFIGMECYLMALVAILFTGVFAIAWLVTIIVCAISVIFYFRSF